MRIHRHILRRAAGFSVIELVTVVAILAIMLAFAIPSYQEFITNYRTSVQTNDLLSDLAIARTEAVKFGRRTEVRAEAGGWSDGWIVWTDVDGDTTIDDDEVVKRHGVAEEDFTIAAGDNVGTPAPIVAFGVTGTVIAPPGGRPLEFSICRPDNDPARSRGIGLARSGRAESRKAQDNDIFRC